ncbi:glycosyltransferase family 39 protein [Oligoflexia bacterium]|nr:glycosyltransferase family 39 protein [Oligoflexia bacterium]
MRIKITSLIWLMLLALVVRIWGLSQYYYSSDDLLILKIANSSTLFDVWRNSLSEPHPPLHYFFLHYLLAISSNEFFLRGVMVTLGTLLVPIYYAIGHEMHGRISALTMAFTATFSVAVSALNQCLRPYTLFLLFAALAWYFLVRFEKQRETKYLLSHIAFSALALLTHYTAIILIVGIGAAYQLKLLGQKAPARESLKWFGLYLSLLVIFIGLYLFRMPYHWLGSGVEQQAVETYLQWQFPDTISAWLALSLLSSLYFTFSGLALFVPAVLPFGFWGLWRQKQGYVIGAMAFCFVIAVSLSVFKLIPFGPSRHLSYLFLFIAILLGAACQQFFGPQLSSTDNLILLPDTAKALGKSELLFTIMLTFLTFGFLHYFLTNDSLRKLSDNYISFPVKSEEYAGLMHQLASTVQPLDIVITNSQTATYLQYAFKDLKAEAFSDRTALQAPQRPTFLYDPRMSFYDSAATFLQSIKELEIQKLSANKGDIWLMNIGWDGSVINTLPKQAPAQHVLREVYTNASGALYRVNAHDLIAFLEEPAHQN